MEEEELHCSSSSQAPEGETEALDAVVEKKEFVAPAVGMEFETYDDAYSYYSCYARELGFRVRVKNSWFKRNSREKYGAVLCCSSQGFKRVKDVNKLRKETRTGCPAMVRMRLVDSMRWRVLEVAVEHNHLLGSKVVHRSMKRRKVSSSLDGEVRKVRLYRALVIESGGRLSGGEVKGLNEVHDQLSLKKGDAGAIYSYLCRMQLSNPSFYYAMDVNDEGRVRNVFWVDARSRASCSYFVDSVFVDNSCLAGKYEIPLVVFAGVNHHGQSVLLGCGLLSGETTDSYLWLFRTWLECIPGRASPKTIITDRCKFLEKAVSQMFPRSQHCFSLPHIMKRMPEKLGGLGNYDAIRKAFWRAVYDSMKVIEFEAAWGYMIQLLGVTDHEWLRSLYEDRLKWVPVYLKDTYFAGIGESLNPFFDKYIHKQTPLKEFLDKYELALHKKHKEEALADIESGSSSSPPLKTRCSFELQLSRVYTREMFRKFQVEVEEMYSCFNTMQIHVDGPIVIFLVKERVLLNNRREVRDYEVLYNRSAASSSSSEVRCICSCFSFYGYLCRHALCVLNFNGVEEVPARYVLPRWRKDYKRMHVPPDHGGSVEGVVGTSDRVEWLDRLHRSALRVVEEGLVSMEGYGAALQALDESLNRVHEVVEKEEEGVNV